MPAGWTTRKLADIATIQGGGTPRRSESRYFGGEVPWVTPTDLGPTGKVEPLGQVAEGLTREGLEHSSARLIPAGSVLFSSRASIGKVAVTSRECATNQGFINLTPKPDAVCPWFLAFLLARFTNELKGLAGKTTFLEIPRGKFKEFTVAVPPLTEQRRIVARIKECVERLHELERLRSRAISEAAAVAPSVLNEVFTSQAAHAPRYTIGEVALETRYGTSQKCHAQAIGVPILRIPNVAEGSVNFDDLKYCELSERDAARVRLQDGDLLFVRTNGSRDLVGRCAVFKNTGNAKPFGFASYLIRVRADHRKVLPRYLAYFLNSSNGRVEIDQRRRTSAGQFNINSESLRSIVLPVPTLIEQERLLTTLEHRESQARCLLAELRAAEAESQGLRNSILQKAFAGEL